MLPAAEAAPPGLPVTPIEDEFSLAPAIFTLFPGFPRDPPPIDVTEKLEQIVEHLDRQHDAVKKNMITLINRRGAYLTEKTERELPILEEAPPSLKANAQRQQDIRNMLRRARVQAKPDAAPGAYEVKEDTFADQEPDLFVSDDEDVEMGEAQPRTQQSVRADLVHDLRDLVMHGTTELENYDVHSKNAARRYKDALERRQSRPGSSSGPPRGPAAAPPRGILANKNGEKPADKDPKKKRATFDV